MKRFLKIFLIICLCLFSADCIALAAEADTLTITGQPKNVTVPVGETATFKVTASGTGLTYTWYYRNPNTTGTVYKKSTNTTNTYAVTARATTHSQGLYVYCVVKDSNGNSATSNTAKLTVDTSVSITGQPEDVTVKAGETATFKVTAKGSGLTYTWYYRNPNTTGTAYKKSSNTTNTYSVTAKTSTHSQGYYVYCVVKDSNGNSATSNIAKMTLDTALSITGQPADAVVAAGETAAFKVTASGNGLTYTWYYRNPNTTGTGFKKSSNTTNTYLVTANAGTHSQGFYVYCVVKDSSGNSVTSNTAKLTVKEPLVITQQPTDVTAVAGEKVAFKVTASGTGLTYTWYYRNPNTTGISFKKSSKTTNTYSVTANAETHSQGLYVYCIVKDSSGTSITSSTAKLTVEALTECSHELKATAYKAAGCETDGNIAYWHCTKCDKYFSDAAAATEITLADTVLAAVGHKPVTDPAVAATETNTGLTEGSHCSVCGKVLTAQEVIPVVQIIRYDITYKVAGNDTYLQGLTIDNSNPTTYTGETTVRLKELEVPGYVFEGWYDGQGSAASRVTKIEKGTTGDIILYAHWSKAIYHIYFDCGDAPLVSVDTITYSIGTTTPLPTPKLTNYDFVGWTDEDGNIVKSIAKDTTGDITLYANWTSKRNQTKAHDYSSDTPVIMEDTDNGIILFAYEIGTIENIPLYQIGDTMNAVAGLTQSTTETVTKSISQETAKTISNTVASATTNSASWSLSKDWNESTSVDETSATEKGYTVEKAESVAKTSGSTYSLNSSVGGSKTTVDSQGYSVKLGGTQNHSSSDTSSIETGQNFGLNVSGKYSKNNIVSKAIGSSWEVGGGVDYSNYKKSTDTNTETDGWSNTVEANLSGSSTTTNSKTWNMAAGYSASSSVSASQSVSETLSEVISNTKHYGTTYSEGGSQSQNQSFATTDSSSKAYSDTVTYNSSEVTTTSKTITLSGETEGYYRFVCAGTAHVFAVVGYDVANQDYFVYTYSVMDDDTYIFTDYSKNDPNFSDNENGVLPFEVPYFVNEYVDNRITQTNGLVIDTTTGYVTGYTGDSAVVCIPSYYSLDNRDGTRSSIKIKGISANAFKGNTSIVAVRFGSFITEIPGSAFEGCTSLKAVYAPGVTSIGEKAFKNCTSLETFNISESIQSVGNQAFENVSKITAAASNENVADAIVQSGAKNITVNISAIESFTAGKTYTVPEGCDSFEIQGGKKDYTDLQINSASESTVINGINFVGCSRTSLMIDSENLTLNQVNISGSSYGMILSAENTNVKLYSVSSIVTSSANAVLCKNITLSQLNAGIESKLKLSGNLLICGNVTGGSYLVFEKGEIKYLTADEYESYKQGTFTLTFNVNGGNQLSTTSQNCFIGTSVGTLPSPTRDYYEFAGWYTAADGGELITADSTFNTNEDRTLYAHWVEKSLSGWVTASSVPSGAQIVNQKWTYTERSYTTSGSSDLSGWTKYDTQRTSWGGTQGPVYSDPSNGVRNVWSEQYETGRTHYYKYYRWANSSGSSGSYAQGSTYCNYEEINLTYALTQAGTSGGYRYYYNGSNYHTYWSAGEWDDVSYGTRWYYQDPVYTYYYYQDVNKESTMEPSGSNISNKVQWVQYREK